MIERRGIAEVYLANLAAASLIRDVQRIFAGFVREVGNRFTVGRPCRIALSGSWRICYVSNIALLGGQGNALARGPRYGSASTERASTGVHIVRGDFVIES